MLLEFNEGAIVRLCLLGFSEPTIIVGKVIKVSQDTVELCRQLHVYRNGNLDNSCSADSDSNIFVRRHLIQNWRYARIRDLHHCGHISDGPNPSFGAVRKDKPFESFTFNYYDKNGLIKGDGRYCGNIEESPSTITIHLDTTSYDDGK